jgi:hypothetical protein
MCARRLRASPRTCGGLHLLTHLREGLIKVRASLGRFWAGSIVNALINSALSRSEGHGRLRRISTMIRSDAGAGDGNRTRVLSLGRNLPVLGIRLSLPGQETVFLKVGVTGLHPDRLWAGWRFDEKPVRFGQAYEMELGGAACRGKG